MSLRLQSAGIIAGIVSIASVGHGAVIGKWDFQTSLTAASAVDPNATAAPLARGTSTNAPGSTNDFWASKPVMSISRSDDTAAQAYFQVTLTANPGYLIDMDSWTFDGARGGASAPRTYEVHSSVAGLARDADISPAPPTSLISGQFLSARGAAGATDPLPTFTADLSAPAYNAVSSLTMRVYFFTPTVAQNIDVDNLTFNGVVFAVPEPSSISAGLGLVIGTLGVRRRRR
jgi:hypothetical protein